MALLCFHGIKPFKIDENKANLILNTLSDSYNRDILNCIKYESKSVIRISIETHIPLASVYRKIIHLKKNNLLFKSAIISDDTHKKIYFYRSKIDKVEMSYNKTLELKVYSTNSSTK